jgi:hypothetical protein
VGFAVTRSRGGAGVEEKGLPVGGGDPAVVHPVAAAP